ncbi:RHS repeat-associated core domain-containing protein [Denitromonas iodatirespirans]|uniref:RHS repeat protein n=1 Tax=Denitromonas iodatirespirans TaxID=2795389 RepID=A0A944D998_DENI1|nr:RHS repeat-associated core domain-containing protein [Denitromonas iodatirespirans]MBT0960257.1 RHS repeat protein [Denitromonas iodatirespirans]
MRRSHHLAANPWAPFPVRHRRSLAAITLACFVLTSISPAFAGGYVDGNVVLNPARAINTGAVSVTPTFNNDQFNDQLLVGTVNNDPVRTPSTADPISTVSGNNYHDETDFVIRGRNGLNTVFTRTYNSAPSSTKADRGLGYGWVHSYMMRLVANDFGNCPNCTSAQAAENGNTKTSSITYTDERGGEQNYLVDETTYAVTAPKGVYDTLTLDSPAAGQHTLAFRNGVKYIFETPSGTLKTTPDVVARLKYIDNAWGDRLTLAYDANGRLSSVTDNLGIAGRTGIAFTYDTNGRLKDVSDWTARKWSFAYDSSGNLQSLTNPLSQVLTYGYDAPRHLLTSIAKPLQRDGKTVQTKFSYYQNGRTFQQTNSFDVGDTLDYDLYRKSTRVTDARGYVREYHYDDNGRMTKLVEPDGGVLLFDNQGDAIRSKKYDALGYATSYSYRLDRAFTGTSDVFGNVTREQDALNRTVDMSYGPLDQVVTTKDKRGTTSTTTFAAATSGCDYTNRPKETRISALSGSSNVLLASLCWNGNATLNTSRQYLDATRYRETRLSYTDNGLNVSQAQIVGMPSGVTVTRTTTYDSLGRVKTETLKRRTSPTNAALIDLTTRYDYDALDRVIKATDSLGNEVINSFDANGQLWKVTHQFKKPDATFEVRDVLTRTFDAADRVKTETDAEGNTTTYSYDEAGNVIAVLDAEGHTTRFEYDAMNRRTAVIDATGYRTETKYSQRGDVVGITNANGETVRFEVDALGRKTATVDAKGHRSEYRYDENGNLTCVIDANAQAALQPKNSDGCTESRQYDELNRVTRILDALNGETRFTYDLTGNRLTVTDAENKTWSFAYDDLGRLKSETDHSGKSIAYKADEAGSVFEKTDRLGEVTRYSFDAANRLMRVDYLVDASAETYAYDAAGNRSAAANGSVSYSFQYDRLNRLTSKTDSRGRSLSFTYDAVGNILTKTTYQGSTTAYVYNAANRLVMLRNPDYTQVDYQYDPAGRLLSRVTANGARETRTFDANGWLESQSQFDAAGSTVSATTYTRDRVGNILTTDDGAGTASYAYDALYRLETADHPGTADDEAFGYDKVGNRKTATRGSLTPNASTRYYSYTAGTNRLANVRIGSTSGTVEASFTHDFEGRLTSQSGVGAKTLTWDAKGRLWTLTDGNGTEVYEYDPMDYRIGRSGGVLGNRDYFLEGEHLESVYAGGVLKEKYFRGSSIDELVAAWMEDTDGKTKPYLFHHDNVNNVTAVTGHNGGTSQAIAYSAFGKTVSSTGASPNRLKYTGREDDGSGLYYYRARYYDPVIGRFISEDPIGFASGDMSFYVYAGNNPVNANDPTGYVRWGDALSSGLGMLSGGAGVIVGGATTLGGGALLAAPEPTFLTKVAGVGAVGFGTALVGKSSADFTLNAQNFISALRDQQPSVPSSLFELGAGLAYPGNRDAQLLAVAGNLTIDLASGRIPVGVIPDLATVGSALQSNKLASFSELTNFRAAWQGTEYLPVSVGAHGSSLITNAVDALQLSATAQTAMANYDSVLENVSSSWAGGGFLLYPNKANSNMTQSVYAK